MNIFNVNEVLRITREKREAGAAVALTAEQQQILDAVNNGRWGCQNASVRALVTAITGIDCHDHTSSPYVQGAMIVFRPDRSDETETLLIRQIDSDGDARFFTCTGATETRTTDSSYMPPYLITDTANVRWATDEEIQAFFTAA